MSDGDWLGITVQAGTWALVILGWALVNRQNNRREERKEIREFVSDISKRSAELRDASFKYHRATARDNTLSSEILFKLKLLGIRLSALKKYGVLADTDLAKRLRQAITMENFDSAGFRSQDEGSKILGNIEQAVEDLASELERAFFEHFLGGKCRSFCLCNEHLRDKQ